MFHRKESDSRISIDLLGPEGNAFSILATAKNLHQSLVRVGVTEISEWEDIKKDMMSSDYKHLVTVFEDKFGDWVDIFNSDVLD